jgi:hypothetical protein
MRRSLSVLLAAVIAASSIPISIPIAAADQIQLVASSNDSWRDGRGNDNWRWRQNRRPGHFAPGYHKNFGIPHPRYRDRYVMRRDCHRDWDGSLYCR